MVQDERNLRAEEIIILAVTFLLGVIGAEIFAWGITEGDISYFLLLFNVFLVSATIITFVRICQVSIPGKAKCHENISVLKRVRQLCCGDRTRYLFALLVGSGVLYAIVGLWLLRIGLSPATDGGENTLSQILTNLPSSGEFTIGALLISLALTVWTHAFAFNQVIESNWGKETIHQEHSEIKEYLKILLDRKNQ